MFQKVLVLSASAGAGHVRAAEAVVRAVKQMDAAKEVLHVDTLQYTTKLFRNVYSKVYLDMVGKAPELLGWLYDQFDKPWKNERRRLAFDKLNTRPFVKLLTGYKPDITICTHFLPGEIISWLKAKERLAARQAIVVTDFDVHAMWLVHHCEQYFVALDETRVHLERLGIPGDKITVSGIPIDPDFSQPRDKHEARARLELEQDKTTLLVSAGGFGARQIKFFIGPLLELKHPAQVVVVCGRNEELRAELDEMVSQQKTSPTVTIRVLGFTDQMAEYMAAADILVGKPGGLTTSEALARGLVLVVVNPIPGQEERNSDHLLEEGVAIRCNNLPALAYKIDRLLDDGERFRRMQDNARRMARPDAAREIVRRLLQLCNSG